MANDGGRKRPSGLDRDPRSFSEMGVVDPQREEWKPAKMRASGRLERKALRDRLISLAEWSHKNEGTPETHTHAARTNQGALARLFERGVIDKDQLAWACEIGAVAEMIERDVAVRVVSYEPRIDHETHGGIVLALEGVMRVRQEMAYGRWRLMLPMPKRLVLDMIVGEPIGFTVAARRYGVDHRKTRKILIAAIDRWPGCLEWACEQVDQREIDAAHYKIEKPSCEM